MKVMLKAQTGTAESFSFPMEMRLDERVVKNSKILPALRRIAKRLKEQTKTDKGEEIIGIEFIEITFSYLFQPPKPCPHCKNHADVKHYCYAVGREVQPVHG